MKTPAFVGLDLETTGLDAEAGTILEVGIVLFDSDLRPITGRSWLVDEWESLHRYLPPPMSPDVAAMHEKSGLSADLKMRMGEPLEQVEAYTIHYLLDLGAAGLPMLGSSITFDRAWLAKHAPDLLGTFHYRSLDATSVRMAALAHVGDAYRPAAEAWIQRRANLLREEMLTDLEVPGSLKRPHRPIYDLCSSAALATASLDSIARTGRPGGRSPESMFPTPEEEKP